MDRIEQVQNAIRTLREVMVVTLAVEHGLDSRAAGPLAAGYIAGVAEAMFEGLICETCEGPEFKVVNDGETYTVSSACHHNHFGGISWPV